MNARTILFITAMVVGSSRSSDDENIYAEGGKGEQDRFLEFREQFKTVMRALWTNAIQFVSNVIFMCAKCSVIYCRFHAAIAL